MNTRLTTALTVVTAALALGEFVSSVVIWRENDPDSQPWFAVLFGALFAVAAWLLRSGRVAGGAGLAAALCLFEVADFPTWQKHGALDWATDSVYAVLSLAGLVLAAAVLITRITARRRTPAGTGR